MTETYGFFGEKKGLSRIEELTSLRSLKRQFNVRYGFIVGEHSNEKAYLALKYPDVFGRAAVVSPSVWFANKQIVHYTEALQSKPHVRIWMDMGTKEGRTPGDALQSVVDARLLKDTLVKKGWRPGKDLTYFEAEGAEHNETAWAARVEQILEFLFPL